MKVKAIISYDGTNYHGWQIQNNAITVQETVNKALSKITGEEIEVTGCSRTDSGVHALTYCVSFDTNTTIPLESLPLAVNTVLPADIRFYSCEEADDDFHARYSATSKTYIYKTDFGKIPNPFMTKYSYHFPYALNIDDIKTAARFFLGTHDFKGFMSTGGSQKTTVRTINKLDVTVDGNILTFEINADAYLYNMVRIISGTLLYVGCGKINPTDIPDIIRSGDRNRAGITALPQGLYLKEVFYNENNNE